MCLPRGSHTVLGDFQDIGHRRKFCLVFNFLKKISEMKLADTESHEEERATIHPVSADCHFLHRDISDNIYKTGQDFPMLIERKTPRLDKILDLIPFLEFFSFLHCVKSPASEGKLSCYFQLNLSPGTNKAIVFPVAEPSQTFDKLASHRPPLASFKHYCPSSREILTFLYSILFQ